MNVVTLNELLPDARGEMIAVPQFNINGYQWIEAILSVIKETHDPVIIGVTDRNVGRLGGYTYIVNLIKFMIKGLKFPHYLSFFQKWTQNGQKPHIWT